ncbi:hypothetical protein OHA40_24495 [Nocardia sp. NBC_00508]|uniref:hypothetical protein n=1 Tax=Nocardia sp. NBC_00508 TaxID=2975992 RepID=UPI002E810371|nr:hypothetical protein [Nocardia sp. NBC_00508]WUD64819.1 hypothetical protein OHA40_24495 [Nocardia sp. NBC_00508]
MNPSTSHTGRTRRVLARTAAASMLALMPITAVAVPALADPIVLEPAVEPGVESVDELDAVHGRNGHRHRHGRNGHDRWNRGRHDDWNRGRHDDWLRGRHRHRHDDWDHGRPGWHNGYRPPTGSGF